MTKENSDDHTLAYTIPQPRYTDSSSVGKSHYTDGPSVGIDIYRHHISVVVSGVGITYTE